MPFPKLELDKIRSSKLDNPERAILFAGESQRNQAWRMLDEMLRGAVVNRHNCAHLMIASKNSSIHSVASTLRNNLDVPVLADHGFDGVCDYWMDPEDVQNFQDPLDQLKIPI